MTLSNKAYKLLAKTLAPKIAEQIMQSESFIEYLHEAIPVHIDAEIGEMDDDLHIELSMMVMERLELSVIDYD